MKKILLKKLLKNIYSIPDEFNVDITGLALDSRTVNPGDLFFACKGTHLDGNTFIDDAIKKGASAILAESDIEKNFFKNSVPVISVKNLRQKLAEISACFYEFPSKKLKMIGITGTNGKTSCSHFIAQTLTELNFPCGIIGTLGSGMYGAIQPGNLTTPDAITLQKTFADLLDNGARAAAMEVSSHSLDQGRVNDIEFEIGIFTNLTRDHLDYHGTMEAYGAAKRKLFENPLLTYSVINADDEFGKKLFATLPHENMYMYSLKNNLCQVYTNDLQLIDNGMRAEVITPWGQGKLLLPLIGHFNLSNALATLTTLCLLGFSFEKVLNCLSRLKSVPGRMEMLGGGNHPLVVVDYSHTPDALEKVLIALRAHCEGKLICVFGCGGDRDRGKRPIMASIAEKFSDHVWVTDDNPRTENPEQIVKDILQGFKEPNKITVQHDRSKAIKEVIQYAKSGDCILIAGKGAETYQQIGNEKFPFSDVEKVKENLM